MYRLLDTNRVSGVAMALFAAAVAAGFGFTTVTGRQAPLVVGLAIGIYLLFSIKVADQWEKVARTAAGPLHRTTRAGPVSHHSRWSTR